METRDSCFSRTAAFQKSPTRLVLELSRNCNLNCSMCGFGGRPINSTLFMHSIVLQRLIDEYLVAVEEIRLNGRGESTLHPDFVPILQQVRESFPHARLTLFTNLMIPRHLSAYFIAEPRGGSLRVGGFSLSRKL